MGVAAQVCEARPEDNAALCALFRDTSLPANLQVTQERDPDFFALHRMHGGPYSVLTLRDAEDRVLGCASFIVRNAWLHGERIKVGYLCDLRLQPQLHGSGAFARIHVEGLERVRAAHGVSLFYGVVFDANARTRQILTRPRSAMPPYRPMTPYHMVSVHFTGRRRVPRSRFAVGRATSADWPEVVAFLQARGRTRTLGEVLDAETLGHRLRTWPQFGLDAFWIARTPGGAIAGCVAPWDTGPFKRTRVLAYRGGMQLTRTLFNAAARLRGFAPLPQPRQCFRMAFMSHLEIADDDPGTLRALLHASYTAEQARELHLLAAMIPRGSPLAGAFRGFMTTRTPMTLYSLALAGSPYEALDLRNARPGFEMALS